MEKEILLGVALAMSISPAAAFDPIPDGVFFGFAHVLGNKAELDDYRVSLRWDWNQIWFEGSDSWHLQGYSDFAINFLDQ